MTFLKDSEKSSLLAHHRLERDKRICDRIKAILFLDKGWSYAEIADALLLDSSTIRRYHQIYKDGGKDSLFKLDYSGRLCSLTSKQLTHLRDYVDKYTPTCAKQVVDYVSMHFKVRYTLSAMVTLLRRLGFTYKKPEAVPGKACPQSQEDFLNELKKIESNLQEGEELFYMDGVHPQHNSKPSYGWFLKGKKSLLKTNTGRKRLNINGALHASSLKVITHSDEAVNSQSTVTLFRKIEQEYLGSKKIIIFCDNAAYYKSEIVKKYLRHSKIELKFLPPYSPNLNLIERLWRFMNKKVRNNKYYEKFQEFKTAIFEFFDNIHLYKTELEQLLTRKFRVVKW